MRVQDAMTTRVITIGSDARLQKAADIMRTRNVGALPVLDSAGGLVGIITASDYLRHVDTAVSKASTC